MVVKKLRTERRGFLNPDDLIEALGLESRPGNIQRAPNVTRVSQKLQRAAQSMAVNEVH